MKNVRSNFNQKSSEDNRILEILERYLADQEAGKSPSIELIIAANPELGRRLRECFESILAVEGLAGGMKSGNSLKSSINLPVLEGFEIVGELGRGGMGVVYEATQKSLSRNVALKVLPLASVFDQRNLQRFKNEAMAMARLDHPNIVNVYSVGVEKGIHFYTMQLVDGQSMADLLKELKRIVPNAHLAIASQGELRQTDSGTEATIKGESTQNQELGEARSTRDIQQSGFVATFQKSDSLSSIFSTMGASRNSEYFRAVAKVGIKTALALHHAHEMGIIHRDIKPSNLLLDSRGEVIVSDFGLATMQGDLNLTATGDLLGTLKYMSPEQAGGDQGLVDHRTDVYSLGATLYELVTLKSVVQGENRKQIFRNILDEKTIPPTQHVANLPADLETILMKALAPEAEHRYGTAQKMADDLQRFLDDQPVLAKRPTLSQRASKWLRRNRWVALTAAVAMFLLVLGSIFSSVVIYRWFDRAMVELIRAEAAEAELQKANERLTDALIANDSVNKKISESRTAINVTVNRMFLEGKKLFEARDYHQAISVMRQVRHLRPEHVESLLWIARAQFQIRRFDEVVENCSMGLEQISQMSQEDMEQKGHSKWEFLMTRAQANLATKPENYHVKQRETAKLDSAIRDIKLARQIKGANMEIDKQLLKVLFGYSVQHNDQSGLPELVRLSKQQLRIAPEDRETIEVALICLWKLKRFSEFQDCFEKFVTGKDLVPHGHLTLLESLYHAIRDDDTRQKLNCYAGLRWCLHRSPVFDHHERIVRNWLISRSMVKFGRFFDAWNDHHSWAQLFRFRIESGHLNRSKTGNVGDSIFCQENMNTFHKNALWTPDYKETWNYKNGVHLLWMPRGDSKRLVLELVDTNTSGEPAQHFNIPYLQRKFQPGQHRMTANLTSSNDFAIVQFWWNGKKLGKPIDLYQPHPTQLGETDFGWVEVIEGKNILEVEIVGRNKNATGVPVFGMDFVDLWPAEFLPGRSFTQELRRRGTNFLGHVGRHSAWLKK